MWLGAVCQAQSTHSDSSTLVTSVESSGWPALRTDTVLVARAPSAVDADAAGALSDALDWCPSEKVAVDMRRCSVDGRRAETMDVDVRWLCSTLLISAPMLSCGAPGSDLGGGSGVPSVARPADTGQIRTQMLP